MFSAVILQAAVVPGSCSTFYILLYGAIPCLYPLHPGHRPLDVPVPLKPVVLDDLGGAFLLPCEMPIPWLCSDHCTVCGDEPSESLGCCILLFSTQLFNLLVHVLSLSQQLLVVWLMEPIVPK